MGKRQHQKDKMYITYTEWKTLYGGKKDDSEKDKFRRLPFDHCCVSLQPYILPCCDKDGNIFEIEALLGYLKKYKHNPVTGQPMSAKNIIKITIHNSNDGKPQCPILFKEFTNQSHVVVNKKTGNVFSYEAVYELNIKPKYFKDLLTDEPFERSDLITLQDPANLRKFDLSKFHHVKNNFRVETEEEIEAKSSSMGRLKTTNKETLDILDELNREYKPRVEEKKETETKKLDKFNAAHYSTGMVAAGFTSTTMEPTTEHVAAVIHEDIVRYERVKKKGYVRLVTNFGPLNLQLHCDQVPKTCENFLKLCQNGYYDNTKFHRSIRNFMIQGGDPTGTGNGGESIWGKAFEDEFKPNLNHTGRGILSMANSGTNTNKSQFFITFRSCRHLDNKHTVFGKVVGGVDTLTVIEQIEVDNKDQPIEDIIILKAQIFVDPYQEADEQLATERAKELEKEEPVVPETPKNSVSLDKDLKVFKAGVGKYINPDVKKESESQQETVSGVSKKRIICNSFGDFSSW